MANPTGQVRRRSARVLLVDEEERVLLFFNQGSVVRGADSYFTVGGGVEEGESLAGAAARELFEETGLRVAPEALGAVVARREGPWSAGDGTRYWAEEHYFFLRAKRFEPDLSGLEEGERNELAQYAWLSLADLDGTDAIVFPIGLAGLLKRLIAGERPETPVELPWVDLTWRSPVVGGQHTWQMNNAVEPRRCARVLVVDDQDQVLLLHSSGHVTPESEFFVTIGGGIDAGETAAQAAVRELFEETGLRVDPADLGEPIGHTTGSWWMGLDDHVFFLLRVGRFTVDFAHLEATEIGELTGSAWLSIDQLKAVDDGVFPVPVADLTKRLIGGDVPAEPVELAWVDWRGDNKRYPLPY